jgi:hypothetical protein
MSWHLEVVATPEGLPGALADLEPPERKAEKAQFDAALETVKAIAATVSRREPMLVTLSGHTDPDGDGFDARNVSVTVSRIEPAEAHRRAEEARAKADEEEAAAAAASQRAEEARAVAERAELEAGD